MESINRFCRDVAHRWGTGRALALMLIVLTAAWAPAMWKMHVELSEFYSTFDRDFLPFLPNISIVGGKVSVDPPGRHVLKDPETGRPVFIIDTSKTAADFTDLEGDALVLTNSHVIVHRERRRETKIHDLSQVDGLAVTRDDISRWLAIAKKVSTPALVPFVLLFSISYRLTQAVLYAALALLFGTALGYPVLLRLALVAIVPVIALDTVVGLSGVRIPFWSLFCLGLGVGGLFYAAKAAAEPATP